MRFPVICGFLGLAAGLASAASLVQVHDFGKNPGSVYMYIYAPDTLAPNPAIIVALHGCLGSARQYFRDVDFHSPADQYGYITIFPESRSDLNCWDVNTKESLINNGGSDSLSIVNMVQYTVDKYKADPRRVFVTGSSSGAMMTQTLAAAYPNVFSAASAFSGMPYGCLRGSLGSSPFDSNPACANGEVMKSGVQWAKDVSGAFPGYNGTYPRLQVWHGTADPIIAYANFQEEIKQWSTVFGVVETGSIQDTPEAGYTKYVYGNGSQFVAFSAEGVGHVVPTPESVVLQWFGITS
ncbi:PHB depolymerase family esterase [Aspergillus ambiguus]|uniref:alpha/beta hydrolase family esterase n=1 Tax=Aspergillus ambiguus TaxID=176160 RepID=UPI003CCDB916